MSDVVLNHIYKVYPNGVKAVSDFNINIKDKEFIVFVGPSGCGKSTTLRMIAGLEEITTGDLYIGDNLVNDVQPKERDIAMVFQNYALYPHMTVYENMAFSLKNRHMPKDEINRRVLEAANVLGIEDYLERKPKAMSGGQRQRVALGRAIVRNPKVFLLDEPLSNLDAKLRAQMRTEISKLHKKLATTFIYVTHDQVEAMTMGTRIVVMKLGRVQQIDTPTNLYNHPINKFVAGFIGTPQMNFFDVTLQKNDQKVSIVFEDKQEMVLDYADFVKCDTNYLRGDKTISLGIRPDNVIVESKANKDSIKVIITSIEKLGNETLLYCDLGNRVTTDENVTKSSIIVKSLPSDTHVIGDKLNITFRKEFIQLFDNDTEVAVMPYCPTYSVVSLNVNNGEMNILNQNMKLIPAFSKLVNDKYGVKIPTSAIKKGKAFALTVNNCEMIEKEKYLLTLSGEDINEFVFAITDKELKKGDSFEFDIDFEQVIFPEEVNIRPMKTYVEAIGHFIRKVEKDETTKKKVINFYGVIEGATYKLSEEFIRRFTSVEGRRTLQSNYRIRFTPKVSLDGEANLIAHTTKEVVNYSAKQFLLCSIGEKECDIDISSIYKKGVEDVKITFDDSKPIEVFTIDNDVRIL